MSKRVLYNVSSANLQATNISGGTISSNTISGTTFTGSNLSLSGNLNVAGTLTTVNITSTNLVNTNVSAGIVVASTSLSATGTSNTIGSIITNSGNVGIGTTSPSIKLDVQGSLGIKGANWDHMYLSHDGGAGFMSVGGAENGLRFLVSGQNSGTYGSQTYSTVMSLMSTGNVGIGTTSPRAAFQVESTNTSANAVLSVLALGAGNTDQNFMLTTQRGTDTSNDNGSMVAKIGLHYHRADTGLTQGNSFVRFHRGLNQGGGFMSFSTDQDIERMRLDTGGNVGIGTTSPSSALQVVGTVTADGINTGSINTSFITSNTSHITLQGSANNDRWIRFRRGGGNPVGNAGAVFSSFDFSHWFTYNSQGPLHFAYSAESSATPSVNNSTSVITLSPNGNVGIGITSPAEALHVNGSIFLNTNGSLWITGRSDSDVNRLRFHNGAGNSFIDFNGGPLRIRSGVSGGLGNRMTINTNGNVGIGTDSPNMKLQVNGQIGIYSENGDLAGTIAASDEGAANKVIIASNRGSGALLFQTNAGGNGLKTQLYIDNPGNVGIGTTSPAYKLHVEGDIALNYGNIIRASGVAYTKIIEPIWQNSQDQLLFYTPGNGGGNANPKLCIQQNGRVGIGTTSPTYTLDVSENISIFSSTQRITLSPENGPRMFFGTKTDTSAYIIFGAYDSVNNIDTKNRPFRIFNSSGNTLFFGATNGNVGIGTTSPAEALHVNGNIFLNTSGNIWFTGNSDSDVKRFRLHNNGGNSYIDFNGGLLSFRAGIGGGNATRMSLTTSGNLSIAGALSKGSGTFEIDHPILENKRLVHSFIEGPRCDLIYRGKVTLINGTATVNMDIDCVKEVNCAMTNGTFTSLCDNPQFFLQNPNSFNRLRGSISGNILTIICEDSTSTDEVYWQVIAERKDTFIKQWDKTNVNGYLITEHNKE